MKIREIIALGFMTLALFVGAGNIIYPPMVGMQAGSNVWITAAGFLITAVGLPILTVIVLAKVDGDMTILSSPIGKVASIALAVVCYLSVGPLLAIPRTATVSYEIGVVPFLGQGSTAMALGIFTFCYFLFVTVVSFYPTKLLDVLGNVLSPLKLLALAILGVAAFLWPAGPVGEVVGAYKTAPFPQGFSDGYLTMDTLGALVFGIVIVNTIRSRNITDRAAIVRYATIAGLMALVGFVLIYVSLFKLGNNSAAIAGDAKNGAVILSVYVNRTFGADGNAFLALLVNSACVVTAIGLTTACGFYFSQLLKVPYKAVVLVMVTFSFAVSNIGLTKLISVSVFALTAIYPPCIVLVVLGFFSNAFRNPRLVFAPVMGISLIFGVLDALKPLGWQALAWCEKMPLSESGLSWLLPSLVVLVGTVILDRLRVAKTA